MKRDTYCLVALVALLSIVWIDTVQFVSWLQASAPFENPILPYGDMNEQSLPAACPVASPNLWEKYTASDYAAHTAAAFTPYHITPGGGEKYLLSVVQVLQSMGFHVTVYVRPGNLCTSVQDIMNTAGVLRVNLNPDMLQLRLWSTKVPPVKVFFVLGNEKYPQVDAIGLVNIFMCQFPFDLDRPMPAEGIQFLSKFEYVILNSAFSYKWYNKLLKPALMGYHTNAQLFPLIEVVHPPVTLLPLASGASARVHIVLLGRFFQGRQSKGHEAAIMLFHRLRPTLPTTTRLVLLGQLVFGHDEYLGHLHDLVKHLNLTDVVQIINSAPVEVVNGYMLSAIVQWHLTGLDTDIEADPASLEHFGISIVEGMSVGCIPVACHGGPEDIITTGETGFIANNLEDVAKWTTQVFKLSEADQKKMSDAAKSRANQFVYSSFQAKFTGLVNRGLMTRPYRHLIDTTLLYARACVQQDIPSVSPYSALLLEGRNHYALEYALINVMGFLTRSDLPWSLHIVHSRTNADLVKKILSIPRYRAVHTHLFDAIDIHIPAYNQLLKSARLWQMLSTVEKVLIFQVDSLLLSPNLEPFMQYDYIGAPFSKEHPNWGQISKATPTGVGSGGISLRSVSIMEEIATLYGNKSDASENEDLFFSSHVAKYYDLAPRQQAYAFCLENPCSDLRVESNPCAIHAIWNYQNNSLAMQLLEKSYTNLVALQAKSRGQPKEGQSNM